MVAVQNNHYFVKDTSKQGTYVRIGIHGKGSRVELVKNATFAVGGVWLKVGGATPAHLALSVLLPRSRSNTSAMLSL